MSHTIVGTVPTPMYRPLRPVFQHDVSTAIKPTTRPYPDGEAGRTVSVTSESLSVAYEVAAIMAKVFKHVTVDGEEVL